jgi:hypothetical protein
MQVKHPERCDPFEQRFRRHDDGGGVGRLGVCAPSTSGANHDSALASILRVFNRSGNITPTSRHAAVHFLCLHLIPYQHRQARLEKLFGSQRCSSLCHSSEATEMSIDAVSDGSGLYQATLSISVKRASPPMGCLTCPSTG